MQFKTILIIFVLAGFACSQKVIRSDSRVDKTEVENNEAMTVEEFWKIIDYGRNNSNNSREPQQKLITEKLTEYSLSQIIDFEIIFRKLIIEADDYKIIAAEKIIEGSVTDDPYLYFRCWLIAQGKIVFTETLKDPDFLADVVDQTTFTGFEELLYVTTEAFSIKTGKLEEDETFPRSIASKKGFNYDFNEPPTKGDDWDEDDLPKLYPKLWKKFSR